ncbi:hypothetical protein HJC23_008100 [Cyclotella cryptica]|uniref:Thioesterase domain-containing protein n=1 Tax=Cyclotella cryptica TaxID=29204 RepID=A0ABD3PHR5_9STRA|eukprot:CCRYP_015001-RA/>CCRYP_015001-RA protein AED:0.00 eAED:0.00 QI:194/-1/1/1/-1/1/1/101/289
MGSFFPPRSRGSRAGIEGIILAMAAALASLQQARGNRDFTLDQKASTAFLSSKTKINYRYNNVLIRHARGRTEPTTSSFFPRNSVCSCESSAQGINESVQFNNDAAGTNDLYIKLNPDHVERTSLQDTHALFGTLRGDGLIERYNVYRRVHSGRGIDAHPQKEIIVVDLKLGHKLNGHDKIVHGGIISLLIDEGLGWAAYESLVHHNGQLSKEFTTNNTLLVTANLNIDFRAPFMAGSEAVIRVHLDEEKTTGRKMYFVAKLESLDGSVVFAEASGLFLCVPKEKISLP